MLLLFILLLLPFAHARHGYEAIADILDIGFGLDINEPQQILDLGVRKDGSKGLQEFTPIKNTIGPDETQFYSFSVNTSTGVGEYYELLIFLTGNICEQPSSIVANETSLSVYWSFNLTMFSQLDLGSVAAFSNGYFEALADLPISSDGLLDDSILYIAVKSPATENTTDYWSYQVGVSQNDLVFQWDDRTWATLVDTDDTSALIVTGNLTGADSLNYTALNATDSNYALYIYSYGYKDYFDSLNSSWCAVRNGPALMSTSNFESSYTDRNGGLQQQFYVTGLNALTKYIAYLVSDFLGTNFGGAVYQPFEFETLDNSVCQLLFDLDFCDQVAYSVPASSALSKSDLKELYDTQAKDLYVNFSKAMQQIACDTTSDASFSPIRTCADCKDSYKNWLCSITIPRCTTHNQTGYKQRTVGDSRNDFINTEIVPEVDYYEILPCVNVCQAMVRDCPSDFGFMCPTLNATISQSYYWDTSDEYVSCNFVGVTSTVTSWGIKLLLSPWMYFVVIMLVVVNI